MRNLSESGRRVRQLALLVPLLLAAVTWAAPARGAEGVTLEARALVGGRYELGGWAAVSVTLTNGGEPVSGRLVGDTQGTLVRRAVDLPAGARKVVTLYLRPQAFARSVEVRFEPDGGGSASRASADLAVLERSTGTVGVVGDGAGNLRAQLGTRSATGLPDPLQLTTADLPERPEPLSGLESIVWADDSGSLSEPQRRALERWVAAGGQLLVLGGADWQARTAAFEALLPVTDLRASDLAGSDVFGELAATEPPELDTLTVASGQLVRDALAVADLPDGQPLAAIVTRGAGRVIYLAADLATPPFRTWPGAPQLWSRLLPVDAFALQFGGMPSEDDQAIQLSQSLTNLPALEIPPAELLLGVIVAYILLIGPGSYLLLRRLDRRELAWVTAPVLVLLFSAGSYGIGTSMKGSEVIVNQVSVIRTSVAGSAASVSTYAGIFSPSRDTYDLTVAGDALLTPVEATFGDPNAGAGSLSTFVEEGDPAHLRGLAVSVFGLRAVRADTVMAYEPSLSVEWAIAETAIRGTVTNVSDEPMDDVAVIASGVGTMVGDLAAGQSRDFSLPMRSTGSATSDQVYGFNSGATGTAEQRQVQARRVVIDSLVGYGSGLPMRAVAGSGATLGPYVIGWRSGAPVEVQVDGEEPQRYAQSVEVVSGRPRLGPGAVSLQPIDLASEVVSVDGEANLIDATNVTIGNGEAVFRVGLPLEATRLVPSRIDIVVSTDLSTLLFNQGNFAALMPPGFSVDVWDVAQEAWVTLGGLDQQSRFEVPAGITAIGPSGAILVRVHGENVDSSTGSMPFFASAEVTGSLP